LKKASFRGLFYAFHSRLQQIILLIFVKTAIPLLTSMTPGSNIRALPNTSGSFGTIKQ